MALYAGGLFTGAGTGASAGLARWRCDAPGLSLFQSGGPGTPATIINERLLTGRTTFNVFSPTPCPPGFGNGPWLGLCFADPGLILQQVLSPPGSLPFHFAATAPVMSFGPYPLPPTMIEGICFDVAGGTIDRVSAAVKFEIR